MAKKNWKKTVRKTMRKVDNTLKKAPVYARKAKNTIDKVSAIAAQVAMLTQLMNVEKKRIDIISNSNTLGQVSINVTGAQAIDITPYCVQGTAYNQRTGSSIKIISGYHKMNYWTQANNNHPMKFVIEYFKIKGAAQTPATFMSDYYQVSGASGVIDYSSERDPDYFGQASLLYKKTVTVPASNFSGEVMIKDCIMGLKNVNHHVRYDQNSTILDDGQIIMIIRADSGNSNAVVSTATNIPVLTASSGLLFNLDFRWYYVDN